MVPSNATLVGATPPGEVAVRGRWLARSLQFASLDELADCLTWNQGTLTFNRTNNRWCVPRGTEKV